MWDALGSWYLKQANSSDTFLQKVLFECWSLLYHLSFDLQLQEQHADIQGVKGAHETQSFDWLKGLQLAHQQWQQTAPQI